MPTIAPRRADTAAVSPIVARLASDHHVRRRYPSLWACDVPLLSPSTWRTAHSASPPPPNTLPQRQQPAAGTHRHKAHAAHRAQLHKHCAKVTRAPQKRGLLPSAVVPRLSALVYAAPFDYGVHCPPRERRRRQLDRQSQRLRVRESTSAYLRATRFLRGSAMSRACVAQRMRL